MLLNGTTQYAKVDYPAPVAGAQDMTIFCLVKTSTPSNDTPANQMIAGMHSSVTGYRMAALRLIDASDKYQARQRMASASLEALSASVAADSTVELLCFRWVQATGILTLNINTETKVVVDTADAPALFVGHALVMGCSFSNTSFNGAGDFFKGDGQYVAQWNGTALSDAEVLSMMDGSTKPDAVTTAPDYYYPLVDNLNSGIAGTAMTGFGSPTFDSVDLWPSAAGPTITNVNTTNIVQVGDTPVVTGTSFLATGGTQAWGGVNVGFSSWADTSITSAAITRGDLAYNTNYDWIVTDNAAAASSAQSVQLAIETGYQVVTLSSPIIVLVGGYRTSLCYGSVPDCVTGDQLRAPTTTNEGKALTLNVDGTFSIAAAGNTEQTFSFEIWDANAATNDKWSASTAAVVNGVIAPIISLPTGTKTGSSTATGTVTTDEGNGTLYFYASTNSSELLATIKASGGNQAVSGIGVQNVNFYGLSALTTYYAHYVHTDDTANDSNVVSSTSFTTDAAPIGESGILRNVLRSPLKNILRNVLK